MVDEKSKSSVHVKMISLSYQNQSFASFYNCHNCHKLSLIRGGEKNCTRLFSNLMNLGQYDHQDLVIAIRAFY
jgi:hypothetical protein